MLQTGPDGALDGSWVENWGLKSHKPSHTRSSAQGMAQAGHHQQPVQQPGPTEDSTDQSHQSPCLTKHGNISLLRWKRPGNLLVEQKPGLAELPRLQEMI